VKSKKFWPESGEGRGGIGPEKTNSKSMHHSAKKIKIKKKYIYKGTEEERCVWLIGAGCDFFGFLVFWLLFFFFFSIHCF
jgi:hypothetical protein